LRIDAARRDGGRGGDELHHAGHRHRRCSGSARRGAAEAERQNAWKAVVPFAVAARYAKAGTALDDAEQRLQQLHAEAAQKDCARHEG